MFHCSTQQLTSQHVLVNVCDDLLFFLGVFNSFAITLFINASWYFIVNAFYVLINVLIFNLVKCFVNNHKTRQNLNIFNYPHYFTASE